ncbi:MAG TPA: ATP-binding protein [Pyrinomonadaceae bacterium]|nr:ATP-binding protein [Pyrinomonadaceae bacterium]
MELEEKTRPYLELIRRIDMILAGPVNTLIRITDDYIKKSERSNAERTGFPVWMSDYLQPEPEDDLFSKVISFATLQEIWKLRRRFSWLTGTELKLLKNLKSEQEEEHSGHTSNRLIQNLLPSQDDFEACRKTLSSNTFGALNPLTAAQTYQVLIRDSERQTHAALGSLALFAMIWPLFKRFPDQQRFGAAIEPWEAKAYVTAKCTLPIKALRDICTERASLMTQIVDILKRLEHATENEKDNAYQRWRFNAELDDLRVRLSRLSSIVVAKDKLRKFSQLLKDFSDGLSQDLRSSLLTIEDLTNPTALASELRDSKDGLAAHLREQFSQKTQKRLAEYDSSSLPSLALLYSLVDEFNRLLRGPCLFNKALFARVELNDIQKFIDQQPRGHARIHLNWLLLAKAFPGKIATSQGVTASFKNILQGAMQAIREIGAEGAKVINTADKVLKAIDTEIIGRLNQPSTENLTHLTETLRLKLAREYTGHPIPKVRAEYFNDLHTSASKSLEFCLKALNTLKGSYDQCAGVTNNVDSIETIVSNLASANREVANMMDSLVANATAWCRSVADREIAHASAQNLTDFDPSELVSAIAVAVKWKQITTAPQVSDAIDKALAGMRVDGSWSPGQPFYSPNNAVGIWPITSDVVLTLTEVLEGYPEIDVADAALFRYVDWLERTLTKLNFQDQSERKTIELVIGWPSDRFRHPRKIHFPTTAYSIMALLKIRDLVEFRLWQLCEKRFTVIKSNDQRGLKEVAPVDLGAQHSHRLHRHLAWMAEEQKRNYEQAEYSVVLHGPPGSSKTFIAQALSVEQWKAVRPWGSQQDSRMLRITPADFTRMGEDRLDSEARLIFDLLRGVRGVTIFFDEIDDLLRQRNTGSRGSVVKPSFMELVVPAMLNRLADLREACPRQELCVVLATNYIESIEPALLRKGRIDRPFPVVYPDQDSRQALIIKLIAGETTGNKTGRKFNEKELSKLIHTLSDELAKALQGQPYLNIDSACSKVRKDLKLPLGHLRSKREALIQQEKDQFLLKGRESIAEVLEEQGAQDSALKYEERLAPPFRQELLNEYAHFIIADCKDSEDLKEWVRKNQNELKLEFEKSPSDEQHKKAHEKQQLLKELSKKIKGVLDNENRWIKDRSVREKLDEFA